LERGKRKEERAKRIRETTPPASSEREYEHLTKRIIFGDNRSVIIRAGIFTKKMEQNGHETGAY
jgi:hypothetical protein